MTYGEKEEESGGGVESARRGRRTASAALGELSHTGPLRAPPGNLRRKAFSHRFLGTCCHIAWAECGNVIVQHDWHEAWMLRRNVCLSPTRSGLGAQHESTMRNNAAKAAKAAPAASTGARRIALTSAAHSDFYYTHSLHLRLHFGQFS